MRDVLQLTNASRNTVTNSLNRMIEEKKVERFGQVAGFLYPPTEPRVSCMAKCQGQIVPVRFTSSKKCFGIIGVGASYKGRGFYEKEPKVKIKQNDEPN